MKRVMILSMLVACGAALAQAPATQQPQGQNLRRFPANAQRGELTVTQPPFVLLNGKQEQLAPGARIFSEQNLLVLSGAVVGQRLKVSYTRDLYGNVKDVWVLTPEEQRAKADETRVVGPDGARILQ
jgi:hypothetical protein